MRLAHPPQPDQEQTEAVIDRPTRICIWVILLGLANFLAYTLIYMFIGGEAVHGHVDQVGDQLHYYLQSGKQVSLGVYIYSGIHSTSIWLTVAAIMLAMLTLAKERIVSSMASSIVRGRTLITILATIITLVTVLITIYFIMTFLDRLWHPQVVLHAGS